MKRLLTFFATIAILLVTAIAGCKSGSITVVLNGEEIVFENPPIIKKGRILVPAETLFEELGAQSSWEPQSQRLDIERGDTTVHFFADEPRVYKNGIESEIESSPIIIDDSVFVPLREACDVLNCIVIWEDQTRTAQIATSEAELEFSGEAYVELNNGMPEFEVSQYRSRSFEEYSELDYLGRAGRATANIGIDIMPTKERESIGSVKPTGWHTVKYDFVDGKYLYNRCHLIGYQLSAENANEKNLITGTRYMNVEGMLPFENMVAEFVRDTNMHVLYRVTPVYDGDNLLASGVKMEGYSVEDNGEGICFNIYCFNAQPGVEIDYRTGESNLSAEEAPVLQEESKKQEEIQAIYILNISSMKFHKSDCSGAKKIASKNCRESGDTREVLLQSGYTPCGICKP